VGDPDVEFDDMNANDVDARRQALSALADGEADAADAACRAWRDDAGARADWHAYHLIGEAMRSDDVRCAPRRDAEFLSRLRERMAAEPVVLAPERPARTARHNHWGAPVAIAAGFAAVAGVLVVMRMAAPDGTAAERSALVAQASAASAAAAAAPGEAKLIRSAELDRYLAAHRQYSNSSALAVPGGAVRNAAVAVPGR
jgi:sigma-E factor negative regulatory protein RseA